MIDGSIGDLPYIMDFDGDPVLFCACFIIALVIIYCIFRLYQYRLEHSKHSRFQKCLYANAKRLGLQVCEVKNDCMFAAIADQLTLKCPNGNYTVENLQKHVLSSHPREWKVSVTCRFRLALNPLNKQDDWQTDVDKLQRLADAICRVIEIVHDQRRDTTVIRPFDSQVGQSLMTLYIGRCQRGKYYSLRHTIRECPEDSARSLHLEGTECTEKSIKDIDKDCIDDMDTDHDAIDATQNNTLCGTNCRQYVINRSKAYGVQNNTVTGSGNTQNVLVTVESSEELSKFLHDGKFSGGEETSIHLKIRQRAENTSTEKLEKDELSVIEALNDCNSKERTELDKILERYDVSFESAMQGCIFLNFRIRFKCSTIQNFIDVFNHKENKSLLMFIIHNLIIDTSSEQIKLFLKFDFAKGYQCNRYIDDPTVTAIGKRKSEIISSKVVTKEGLSKGISITCKPKKEKCSTKEQHDRVIKILQTELLELLLHRSAQEVEDFTHLDLLASDTETDGVFCLSHDKYETRLLEIMNGLVGIIKTEDGRRGTCFLASSNYILSAGHLFHSSDVNSEFKVQFPGENHLTARLTYLCEEVDFAILEIQGNVTGVKPPMYHLISSAPGQSFDFMFFKGSTDSKPFIERAVVGTNKCYACRPYACNLCSTENVEWTRSYSVVEALGDHIRPGCSGSPGVLIQDDKLFVILILIGTWHGKEIPSYVGLKMVHILSYLERLNPKLASEVFRHFIKATEVCDVVVKKCEKG
ncbi:hypothetical protein ACF0H5_012142 [Mactra antiquata]